MQLGTKAILYIIESKVDLAIEVYWQPDFCMYSYVFLEISVLALDAFRSYDLHQEGLQGGELVVVVNEGESWKREKNGVVFMNRKT